MNKNLGLLLGVFFMLGSDVLNAKVDATLNLKFSHTPAQVTKLCDQYKKSLTTKLDTIANISPKLANFENASLALESALTDFSNDTSPLTFLKDVSTIKKVRTVASDCDESLRNLLIDVFARKDLFEVLKSARQNSKKLSKDENKLLDEQLSDFKRNGLELSDEKRAVFLAKQKELVGKEKEFNNRLTVDKSGVDFTIAELEGLSPAFIKRLKKGKKKDTLQVSINYPDYYPFMENAKDASARKRLEFKFNNNGGERNKNLLEAALKLRHETALMLGYSNHAAYVLEKRMAAEPKKVTVDFLKPIIEKLIPKGRENLSEMLELKKLDEPKAAAINAWDWRYYENQLKKKKYDIDSQLIAEYFPVDVVLKGMFDTYQTLLGVTFIPVDKPVTWHKSVTLYRVERDGIPIAFFYMDLFPREGKYGHAAAFSLINGYLQNDGSYRAPIASIVANMNPPSEDSPSLLEHGEVETLFHEFGHIMHDVMTKARFSTFAGTNVRRDFVEAPSQMLENWVWEIESLNRLSSHYKRKGEHLPPDLINRMIKAKLSNAGIKYLRQAAFATIDMTYHTSPDVDSSKVFADSMRNIMLIPIQEGTLPQAGFGHLMGGYDAGYYGYLWSEVYAADMFTRFKSEGLLNPRTGGEYLKWILEPGGTMEPMELIKGFLGRPPNQKAFLKDIGI